MIKIADIYFANKNNLANLSFRNSENTPNIKSLEMENDSFISSTAKKAIGISAGAIVLGAACYKLMKTKPKAMLELVRDFDKSYINNMANDMSTSLNKQISPEQLTSIMGKEELSSLLPKLKQENFMAFKEVIQNGAPQKVMISKNLQEGIFQIDLHSHTNYSDGQATVENLLDNVVKYADKLNSLTGKKFIFSITDHDTIAGTKEAIRLIAENPEKYKNLRFVPGVELSFAHKTDKGTVEVSEMLIHGINPFSEKTNNFINSLIAKRKNASEQFLQELNTSSKVHYSLDEVNGDFLYLPKEFFKYKMMWRMYNYAQIKQRLSALAIKWGKNPEAIYREIMPQWHVSQGAKTPDTFEQFMLSRMVDLTHTSKIDKTISNLFEKYLPNIVDGKVNAPVERTFEELIEHFSMDNESLVSLAHPAFLAKYFNNPKEGLTSLINTSNGLIKATEKYHQAYSIPESKGVLSRDFIDKVNLILDEFKLLNLGGHDNHKPLLI